MKLLDSKLLVSATRFGLVTCLCAFFLSGPTARAQAPDSDQVDARTDTATLGRQLGSPDPVVRRRAAEAIAQLAAVDQKKLVEGYYLQEKNKQVRLALEWASYRIGKEEALFRIVHDLDSSRHDQAVGYLAQLDSPELLYPFLKREDNRPKITVGLLEALARLGDSGTIEHIKDYRDSFEPGVAAAAEKTIDEIEARLSDSSLTKPTRPRTVGKPNP